MSGTFLDLYVRKLKGFSHLALTRSNLISFITPGTHNAGIRCAGFPRNTNDNIDHQQWIIKRDTSNNTYTLKSHWGGTYLDLQAGFVGRDSNRLRSSSYVLSFCVKEARKWIASDWLSSLPDRRESAKPGVAHY